jgi:hypothetical protein
LTRRAGLLLTAAILVPPTTALGQGTPLGLVVTDGAPTLVVGPVLDDPALEEALRSGLPLRLRARVELWRDRLFDELVDHVAWTQVLLFEPLDGRFLLGNDGEPEPRDLPSYAAARAAIETTYALPLRPRAAGRYYYLAYLEIETLSLSDLEELGHWLRGEAGPAVQGRRSVLGAVGTGMRRLVIRVLDLPVSRYQARSERFSTP